MVNVVTSPTQPSGIRVGLRALAGHDHAPSEQRSRADGRPRLEALTGLRFLAAMHIVVFHFASAHIANWPVWLRQVIGAGGASVMLFFILSGFVLAYNYLDGSPIDKKKFWVARFARIYPAYLLAFLLTTPYALDRQLLIETKGATGLTSLDALTSLNAAGLGKLVVYAGLSLGMVQAWLPQTILSWNPAAWSLSDEAFFYALFPFLGVVFVRATSFRLCVMLVVVLGLTAARLIILGVGPTSPVLQSVLSFSPEFRVVEFILGICLGRMFLLRRTWLPVWLGTPSLVAGALVVFWAAGPWPTVVSSVALSCLFAWLVFALATRTDPLARVLSSAPLRALGEASYGIYILQIPVAWLLRWVIEGRVPATAEPAEYFSTWPQLTIFMVVLTVISIGSHYVIEQPTRRWLRSRMTGVSANAAERSLDQDGPSLSVVPAV
jgi:peptidoglycan/LPS O-acetylase OafA/YrhL